jgi:hypothetical protein|tara:strand:- start:28 stop:342 length:315 start_codon:yes stop_codon:yes gene_type:complete
MRTLDYTDFVRVEGKIVRDIDGKYKSNTNSFTKPVVNKNWYTKERKDLVNIMLNSKNISYKTVNESFKAKGYSGLRPVHVELVKRYIKLNRVSAWITGKPLIEK